MPIETKGGIQISVLDPQPLNKVYCIITNTLYRKHKIVSCIMCTFILYKITILYFFWLGYGLGFSLLVGNNLSFFSFLH